MNAMDESLQAARERFIEGLLSRGFGQRDDDSFDGSFLIEGIAHEVQLRITSGFPFVPPAVYPGSSIPRSWHRELDGAMCLYPQTGREYLPWLRIDDLFATIREWLVRTRHGWTNDAPALDLERYFHPSTDQRMLIYDTLTAGTSVRIRLGRYLARVEGLGSAPRRKFKNRKRRRFACVLDIGEPPEPPTNWPELSAFLLEQERGRVERAMREGTIDYLLVLYCRGERAAVLGLECTVSASEVRLRRVPVAPNDDISRSLRSGRHYEALQRKSVLVVGAGAVGSQVCDALARAGVGAITVRDADVIRPGNLVRHLVDAGYVGHPKATAVRDFIRKRQPQSMVISVTTHLTDPDEAVRLLEHHDLVIDCTAEGVTSAMLGVAAKATGTHLISVCTQREGDVARVDIIPPLSGAPLDSTVDYGEDQVEVWEAGCGEPVSRTPYYAVMEAAALAARHAVGILAGSAITANGSIHDYR